MINISLGQKPNGVLVRFLEETIQEVLSRATIRKIRFMTTNILMKPEHIILRNCSSQPRGSWNRRDVLVLTCQGFMRLNGRKNPEVYRYTIRYERAHFVIR